MPWLYSSRYWSSLLPLIGDKDQASLQGATARLAALPMHFALTDNLVTVADTEISALSDARLVYASAITNNDTPNATPSEPV